MRTKTDRLIRGILCLFVMERPDSLFGYLMLRVSGFMKLIDIVHIILYEFVFNRSYISLIEGVLHDKGDNGPMAGVVSNWNK